jgi:hypothetical protein
MDVEMCLPIVATNSATSAILPLQILRGQQRLPRVVKRVLLLCLGEEKSVD